MDVEIERYESIAKSHPVVPTLRARANTVRQAAARLEELDPDREFKVGEVVPIPKRFLDELRRVGFI